MKKRNKKKREWKMKEVRNDKEKISIINSILTDIDIFDFFFWLLYYYSFRTRGKERRKEEGLKKEGI